MQSPFRWLFAWLAAAGLASPLLGQDRTVRGTVTDATTLAPLAEAVVSVVGSSRSARTDAQGRYEIAVPPGSARLTARSIGYSRQTRSVGDGAGAVDFALTRDIFKLEEVIVSGQATGVERRQATTSVSYVSGEEVTTVASATLENALYGRMSGVNIQTNSGAPGGGFQLQIRGSNTILGAFDPLFVVDGVIYSNARLQNGRGTITNNALELDDPANRVSDINPADIASVEVLKGAAAAQIYGSKAANGVVVIKTLRGQVGSARSNVALRLGTFDLLRSYAPRCLTLDEAVAGYGPNAAQYYAGGASPCFDHYDQLYGGHSLSYELVGDVSGGTEATRYFASTTWKRDGAIEPGTGFGRQGLRVNLSQRLSSKWDVQVTTVLNRAIQERGWDNDCNNFACAGYAFAYTPSFLDLRKQADGSYLNPGTVRSVQANPLQTAELARNRSETYRFTGGATVTWNAFTTAQQSLRFVGNAGADLFNQNDDLLSPNDLFYEQPQARPGTSIENNGRSRQLNWNGSVVHTIRAGPQFTSSLGVQFEDRRLHTSRIVSDNLLVGQENVNQGTNIVAGEFLSGERTFALYGQEDVLLLDDRLLLSGGLRAERTSANGAVATYHLFPKISGKYSFPNLIGAGSEVKFRAAYGEIGNQPTFGLKFTTLATPTFGGVKGLGASSVAGDPGIEPERVREVELGVDATLADGRASLDVSLFQRRTSNLLLSRTPAPSTGYTTQIFNGGEIQNRGIELALGVTPIQQRNTSWVATATFTAVKSKVLSLPVPPFRPPGGGVSGLGTLQIEEGKSLTRIVGTLIDANDDVVEGDVGDTNPDFQVGTVQTVRHRALSLSVVAQWQQGGNSINLTQFLRDDGRTTADYGLPSWRLRDSLFFQRGAVTPYIESSTFLKIREISLGVEVPPRWLRTFGIQVTQARVSLTARNPIWWTAYTGLDPEVSSYGGIAIRSNVDITPYPPSRSFFFNIALGF
jgi:TonB-linked SusC/RagA family outer membrane protein